MEGNWGLSEKAGELGLEDGRVGIDGLWVG